MMILDRHFVIASEAKQSRAVYMSSGLPRGFAARNDDSSRCHHTLRREPAADDMWANGQWKEPENRAGTAG
jgi:hypothetical protein